MKIYEDISKQFFIYDNIVSEPIFDDIFIQINKQLKLGNKSVRFAVLDKKSNKEFRISQKTYNEFSEHEIEMFNKNYDDTTSYQLLRRDCDINLSDNLDTILIENINNIVKYIYNLKNVEIEYASIIEYEPGYLMRIHSDATPNNPRLCTAVLYCNDMKDGDVGGNVLFYDNDVDQNIIHTYTPKRNQLVIFDSYFNEHGIPHSVTKIENWNRYVYRIYYKLPK